MTLKETAAGRGLIINLIGVVVVGKGSAGACIFRN